MSLIFPGS